MKHIPPPILKLKLADRRNAFLGYLFGPWEGLHRPTVAISHNFKTSDWENIKYSLQHLQTAPESVQYLIMRADH